MTKLTSGAVLNTGLFLGQFTIKESGKPSAIWALSEDQLGEFQSWLQSHRSEWNMVLATPPLPAYSVILIDDHERRIQIDLYAKNDDWKKAVGLTVTSKDGTFLFGGQMRLPDDEAGTLQRLSAAAPQTTGSVD